MKKTILTLTVVLTTLLSIAQITTSSIGYYSNYNWEKDPKKESVSDQEKQKSALILFEKRSFEFLEINEEFKNRILIHKRILLNNDEAIESFNKYYLGMDESTKILTIKARVIKPNGKIVEVSEKDILEKKDENGNVEYKYFAFEGLEIGSIIEFLEYSETYPELSGSRIMLQSETAKKKLEIDLIYPAHLEFQLHSINGLATFEMDKTDTTKVRHHLTVNNMEGLEEEDWSAYSANLQKFYYKLSKNLASNKNNFYSYTEATKLVYSDLFPALTKKEKKLVTKFIEEYGSANQDLYKRLRDIEEGIKTTISTTENYIPEGENIEFILSKKVTNEKGLVKLMLNILREMGIEFEVVLTTDRTEDAFIDEFEGYNFLQEYLIHIKPLGLYYSPSFMSRIGFPPYTFNNNKGLFIYETTMNNFSTGIGKVKFIKGPDYKKSIDEIIVDLKVNEDMTTSTVQVTRSNTGYKAYQYQPIIDFLDEETKTQFKEEYVKYLDADAELVNFEFKNEHSADFGIQPFIGTSTLKSSIFTENTSDKLLIKVGGLIGPQAEMYHEEKRAQPVDSYYTRGYNQTITIHIPSGYSVKNPEILSISVLPDTKKTVGFTSTYKIDGDKIIIDVKEWYDTHYFSVADYKLYENTMNAAADFNKLVLVLEKK